jgi:hypothetical protein
VLLLTSGVNKWAELSDGGDRALAGVQLALSSGVGFLLFVAVVMAAIKMIRGFHRSYTAKKAAKKAAEAGGEDGNEDGGEDGEAAGRKSMASIKRGSLGDVDEAGEISAISALPGRAGSGTLGAAGTAGAAGGSKPILTGKSGRQLATINVVAGNPLYELEAAASPYADNTPNAKRGLLHRTSSSMSRRSAADNAEARLPIPGSPQPSGPSFLGAPAAPAAPAAVQAEAPAPAAAPAAAAVTGATQAQQAQQAQQGARGPRPWVPPGGPGAL